MGDTEKRKHKHHRHHHHRNRENDNADPQAGVQELNNKEPSEATFAAGMSGPPRNYTVDLDTTEFIGKFIIKDGKNQHKASKQSTSGAPTQPNFLTDRRVSNVEMQRRHTWLQRTRISSATMKNRCRILNEVRFPETFNGLYSARFAPNGEIIASSFGTGGIQIRNGETGDLRTTLKSGLETSFPVMCCRFNPIRTEVFYASSASGNIFMCTTSTNEFTRFLEEPNNEVNTIDVSMSGEHIASGGKDAAVRLYDAESGKLILTYKKDEADMLEDQVSRFHRMRIFASKFHPSYPELLITGGWDDTVRIWDIRVGGGSIRSVKGPHICGDAIDVREKRILTGSWVVSGSLQIWDLMSAKLIETINPQNRPTTLDGEFLYTVQYFDGDPYGETVLVGGSGTGAVEVISLKEKKVIGKFPSNKAVVTLDSCRTTIVFGGMEAVIRIADYS